MIKPGSSDSLPQVEGVERCPCHLILNLTFLIHFCPFLIMSHLPLWTKPNCPSRDPCSEQFLFSCGLSSPTSERCCKRYQPLLDGCQRACQYSYSHSLYIARRRMLAVCLICLLLSNLTTFVAVGLCAWERECRWSVRRRGSGWARAWSVWSCRLGRSSRRWCLRSWLLVSPC